MWLGLGLGLAARSQEWSGSPAILRRRCKGSLLEIGVLDQGQVEAGIGGVGWGTRVGDSILHDHEEHCQDFDGAEDGLHVALF